MAAGKGITATVNDVTYVLGNEGFIAESGCVPDKESAQVLEKLRTEGKASVIVSDADKVVGIIALSDILRPEAADMTGRLKSMGVRTVLLTCLRIQFETECLC